MGFFLYSLDVVNRKSLRCTSKICILSAKERKLYVTLLRETFIFRNYVYLPFPSLVKFKTKMLRTNEKNLTYFCAELPAGILFIYNLI